MKQKGVVGNKSDCAAFIENTANSLLHIYIYIYNLFLRAFAFAFGKAGI